VKLNSKEKSNLILGFFIILLPIGYYFTNYKKSIELDTYGEYTTARIVSYHLGSHGKKYIDYVYEVDGVKFKNSESVSNFSCDEKDNKRKFCIGKTFVLMYSKRNPEICAINLGKYEKYNNLKL
jgi:hypothetical protein